jgi:hypothetical protein
MSPAPWRAALACVALLGSCAVRTPIRPAPQDREAVPRPLGEVPADQPGTSAEPWDPEAAPTSMSIGLGAAYWDEIGSLSTAGTGLPTNSFGAFDRTGAYFDLGFDHVVGHLGELPWSLGFEFGIAGFENEGSGISPFSDSLSATWYRFTPTARTYVPLGAGVTLVPGVGFGGSLLSIDEYDDAFSYGWGQVSSSRNLYEAWAWTAFVDLAIDFDLLDSGTVLRIDNEFHWQDFDALDRLLPAESGVGGLIYALQLELVLRF